MSDSDENDRDGDKIVSLDQRRRADQARQKAELAAAAARKKANGSGRAPSQPFGRPMARPTGGGMFTGFGRLLGQVSALAVWGGLVAMIALAVLGAVAG